MLVLVPSGDLRLSLWAQHSFVFVNFPQRRGPFMVHIPYRRCYPSAYLSFPLRYHPLDVFHGQLVGYFFVVVRETTPYFLLVLSLTYPRFCLIVLER